MSEKARLPEVITADDPNCDLCTADGLLSHDYRPHTYQVHGKDHTSLRCVWCHVVACGNHDEPDPCLEPYHHKTNHRSRNGTTWPLGGTR